MAARVGLGAGQKLVSQATQRITLTLDPRRRGVAGKPLILVLEQAGECENPSCE